MRINIITWNQLFEGIVGGAFLPVFRLLLTDKYQIDAVFVYVLGFTWFLTWVVRKIIQNNANQITSLYGDKDTRMFYIDMDFGKEHNP